MRKGAPAPTHPDAYVAALEGWQKERVETLRAAVRRVDAVEEMINWGHLVYLAKGPALLIRAEEKRVLFGFWRGQRLRTIEPRLKAGGKYEMASLELQKDTQIDPDRAEQLARQAVALNRSLGNPTEASPASR